MCCGEQIFFQNPTFHSLCESLCPVRSTQTGRHNHTRSRHSSRRLTFTLLTMSSKDLNVDEGLRRKRRVRTFDGPASGHLRRVYLMVGTLMVWLRLERQHGRKRENQEAFTAASLNEIRQVLPWWARERQSPDGGKEKPNICMSSWTSAPLLQLLRYRRDAYLKCLRVVRLPAPTPVMIYT